MEVVSNSNQEMLIDLLVSICNDNNYRVDINNLKRFITEKAVYFHTNKQNFGNLNDINKKIVELGYNYILSVQNSFQKKNTERKLQTPDNSFSQKLKIRENNFEKTINPQKPKEIDFSDGSKDFPINNLERVMNQTLADREKELANITQKYNTTSDNMKWLNREEETTPKIKIDKTSNIELDNTINVEAIHKKKVRFEIKEKNEVENFFSKLKKKKQPTNLEIMGKINLILSNQEKILNELKRINDTNEFALSPI